jgi:hypothetical protein
MKIDPRILLLFNWPRLCEVRWLGARRMSLFTDKLSMIEDAIARPDVAGLGSYIVINPLQPEVVTRRRITLDSLFCPHKEQCSADTDVLHRDLLPFDFDPFRETGTASTLEQRELALQLAERVVAYLVAAGFPDPVAWVDSGNGIHVYFRAASFPNARETDLLLTALYSSLARKFDTLQVKLDKSVRSAAQLMRLPGSFNHKAGRTCEIITFNKDAAPVTLDQVRKVVADLRGELGFKKPLVCRPGSWTPTLLEAFLEFYSIDHFPATEIPQGLLFVLNPCPRNPNHEGTSPAILLTRSGRPKFCCKHASCQQVSWRQFRAEMFRLTKKWFPTPKGVSDAE